uniref:Uncharacterized protein n=1 Tax=Trichogramma kaykai TaxID=54128 RepID=A0ABD2WY60_9HYME
MYRSTAATRWPLLCVFLSLTLIGLASCKENRASPIDAKQDLVRTWTKALFDNAFPREQKALLADEGRTFGMGKRIQFMMMPMIYKMGVIITMLTMLTVISLKGLMIVPFRSAGLILLVLKVGALFGKIYAAGLGGGHHHHQGSFSYGHSAGWQPPPPPPPPVHVHVHNNGGDGGSNGGYGAHSQAYGGWHSVSPTYEAEPPHPTIHKAPYYY